MAYFEPLPELVITRRPTAGLAPLVQRFRPSKRAGLAVQHVQIVLQIKDLLADTIAAFVASHALTLVPHLDIERIDARLNPSAGLDRDRIEVGLDRDAPVFVDQKKPDLG